MALIKSMIEALKESPVIAHSYQFVDDAKNATKINNPISASFSAIKLIIDVYAPPNVT